MSTDFYTNTNGLTSFLEKEWSDFFKNELDFKFPAFNASKLQCSYSAEVASFVKEVAPKDFMPQRVLEVGPSLGRSLYEFAKAFPDLKHALLIEPSKLLCDALKTILTESSEPIFSHFYGNGEPKNAEFLREFHFQNAMIVDQLRGWDLKFVNAPFEEAEPLVEKADLVVGLNVLDQCRDPQGFIDFLSSSVRDGGVLVTSCTYQWQEKYLERRVVETMPTDIKEYFDADSWKFLGEDSFEFKHRRNERYWQLFLSHIVCFSKIEKSNFSEVGLTL